MGMEKPALDQEAAKRKALRQIALNLVNSLPQDQADAEFVLAEMHTLVVYLNTDHLRSAGIRGGGNVVSLKTSES